MKCTSPVLKSTANSFAFHTVDPLEFPRNKLVFLNTVLGKWSPINLYPSCVQYLFHLMSLRNINRLDSWVVAKHPVLGVHFLVADFQQIAGSAAYLCTNFMFLVTKFTILKRERFLPAFQPALHSHLPLSTKINHFLHAVSIKINKVSPVVGCNAVFVRLSGLRLMMKEEWTRKTSESGAGWRGCGKV